MPRKPKQGTVAWYKQELKKYKAPEEEWKTLNRAPLITYYNTFIDNRGGGGGSPGAVTAVAAAAGLQLSPGAAAAASSPKAKKSSPKAKKSWPKAKKAVKTAQTKQKVAANKFLKKQTQHFGPIRSKQKLQGTKKGVLVFTGKNMPKKKKRGPRPMQGVENTGSPKKGAPISPTWRLFKKGKRISPKGVPFEYTNNHKVPILLKTSQLNPSMRPDKHDNMVHGIPGLYYPINPGASSGQFMVREGDTIYAVDGQRVRETFTTSSIKPDKEKHYGAVSLNAKSNFKRSKTVKLGGRRTRRRKGGLSRYKFDANIAAAQPAGKPIGGVGPGFKRRRPAPTRASERRSRRARVVAKAARLGRPPPPLQPSHTLMKAAERITGFSGGRRRRRTRRRKGGLSRYKFDANIAAAQPAGKPIGRVGVFPQPLRTRTSSMSGVTPLSRRPPGPPPRRRRPVPIPKRTTAATDFQKLWRGRAARRNYTAKRERVFSNEDNLDRMLEESEKAVDEIKKRPAGQTRRRALTVANVADYSRKRRAKDAGPAPPQKQGWVAWGKSLVGVGGRRRRTRKRRGGARKRRTRRRIRAWVPKTSSRTKTKTKTPTPRRPAGRRQRRRTYIR